MSDPPKPTGRIDSINIAGMLLPFHQGQPVLLEVPGCDLKFIPLFEDDTQLREAMSVGSIPFDRIKQVEPNVRDFLTSLVETTIPLHLMVKPHFVNGKLRYLDIDPAATLADWE